MLGGGKSCVKGGDGEGKRERERREGCFNMILRVTTVRRQGNCKLNI